MALPRMDTAQLTVFRTPFNDPDFILNDRDLRQLPLIKRKEKLRAVIERSALSDVLCGKYIEERGADLFNEVVRRNLEGVVAKRKNGIYMTVSGWLKVKNPQYTQSTKK